MVIAHHINMYRDRLTPGQPQKFIWRYTSRECEGAADWFSLKHYKVAIISGCRKDGNRFFVRSKMSFHL